jgi:hypothetical protein
MIVSSFKRHPLNHQPFLPMNSAARTHRQSAMSASIPSTQLSPMRRLRELYFRDSFIHRASFTTVFGFFAASMFHWVAQPVPSVVKVEQSPFEIYALAWGPTVGVVVGVIALILLVRRYIWLKRVFCEGSAIKGNVEDIDVYSREASHSDATPAFERSIIRTYYAIIRYAWQGDDKTVRLKLPFSPSACQAFKGHEIDLLVHASAPGKPLIRAMYDGLL